MHFEAKIAPLYAKSFVELLGGSSYDGVGLFPMA